MRAWATGPAGIVGAFVEINNVILVIIEAIREQRVPTGLEFGSFVFAMIGALWFVIPDQLYDLFKCIFCCRCKNDAPKEVKEKFQELTENMT